MRALAEQIRTPTSFVNPGGDMTPVLITLSPLWPQGRALRILDANDDVLTSLGASVTGREPVTLVLRGSHYSVMTGDVEMDVPGDAACFYHAVLAGLGEDAGKVKRQLKLPDDASRIEVIRALREHLADYVEANPQLIAPFIDESSPPRVRVAWEESTRGDAPEPLGADVATESQDVNDDDEEDPYDYESVEEAIKAYQKEPHSHLPIWEPTPQRPWAEPLLQLLSMGMPVLHNWAQGKPLLGPLPEPRKNDLAVDDSFRRVYAFMNHADGREKVIDGLTRALDEWQQSPEYTAQRDRGALAQGRALTAELEATFAEPLSEKQAAKTLDYIYRNFEYCADNVNEFFTAKRDWATGSRSFKGAQPVQPDASAPRFERGARRAGEPAPVFATSAGAADAEAQQTVPLLASTLVGVAMANPKLKAAGVATALVGGIAAAGYGAYRWLTGGGATSNMAPMVNSLSDAPADSAPSMLIDDERHDDEVVANLQVSPDLEAFIYGAMDGTGQLARRVRSASARVNQSNTINSYKPNFSKYDDHVAENLLKLWQESGAYKYTIDDDTVRLMIFNGLLSKLIYHDGKPSSHISDHLMVAAIGEFVAIRAYLDGIRETDDRVPRHLRYMDALPDTWDRFSKIPLYREAFAIKEIDDDLYMSQRELAGDFIYRKRGQGKSLDDIGNISRQEIYSLGIRQAEKSFQKKLATAISVTPVDDLPDAIAKVYKEEFYSHGRELVDYLMETRGFTSNADYKNGIPSDPESNARIEFANVKKHHALTLFIETVTDYAIYKKLKEYGVSGGQYSGHRMALEAKKIAAKLVIEKFGIDANTNNFDPNYYIDAYNQIIFNESISDEVRQYLLKSASMAFYMFYADNLPKHLTWHPDMLVNFYSMQGRLPSLELINGRPDDHIDISKFKRSNECSSKRDYFNQFIDYKNKSLAYDAQSVALNMLMGAGLTEYDISAMKPVSALGADLRLYRSYSRGLGELLKNGGDWHRTYIDVDDVKSAGKYITEPHVYSGPDNAVGKMCFMEMADGRMIVIAVIDGKSKAKVFSANEVASSRALRKIQASMQSGLPAERDDQVGRGQRNSFVTSPYVDIEGRVLVEEILEPLFGEDYRAIGFEENGKGYVNQAFPQLTAAKNLDLDLSKKEGLYPIATAVANRGLEELVTSLKGGLEDRQWWEYVMMFVPFADEIYRSAVDKDHKVDGLSITADVMGTIFSIIPFVGQMGKFSAVTTKVLGVTFKRAMLEGMAKGLTGKKLTMTVLAALAKEAPALSKAGLRLLASAAYAAADVVLPISPDLVISPVTRLTRNIRKYFSLSQNFNGPFPTNMGGRLSAAGANIDVMNAASDEVEALRRTTAIAVDADRSIVLRASALTPGQTIEESSALFEPLSRKQLAVMRADEVEPYRFVDICALPHRVARQTGGGGSLSCFPFTSRADRLAAGDISAIQGIGPTHYAIDGEPTAGFRFDAYRSDDIGDSVNPRNPVRVSFAVPQGFDVQTTDEFRDFIWLGETNSIISPKKEIRTDNLKTISVGNGNSGTVAVKIPLWAVSEGNSIFVHNAALSGCTVVYAVKDGNFYIYHTGLVSNADGLDPNWRTAREGVVTLADAHSKLTGTVPRHVNNNNDLVDIFSTYDSAIITYMGKDGTKITNQASSVTVFDYNEANSPRPWGARLATADALLSRVNGKVKIEALSQDYFNSVKVGKSEAEVYNDYKLLDSRRVELKTRDSN
ncbi:cytotoxic necrotizing factor Rho-activating domain-containing protein [Burkholderia sp. HI2714]|uniref:cytotoxic necrotizing factor Rho-activating domain-containing protein n=1 Tax=Burkholderia sp. HI2714 TaxID=2015359 RepID=UPI0015C5F065|nr:cytotoxic necrotizing factor Rho-activating domain-containing protein [Burkholderia sp. HI2714]